MVPESAITQSRRPLRDESYWLEWQLENWARWMRSDEKPAGLPEKASGRCIGFLILGDSEAACEQMDIGLAEATNAAIEGLEALQQAAIYATYGVASVWTWKRCNRILAIAKAIVAASLKRRGVWMGE